MYHARLKGSHYEMGVKRGKMFNRGGVSFPLHLDDFQTEHGRERMHCFCLYKGGEGDLRQEQ